MDHRMFKLGLCPQEHIPMALDIAPKPLGIVTVEILVFAGRGSAFTLDCLPWTLE